MTDKNNEKRILELSDEAFTLPEDERAQFLDEACAGDERLRASVDSVLIAVEQAGSFLRTENDVQADATNMIGRRIGSFEIRQRLGEGGMGSVYLAERRDGGYEQRVAIKFVHNHLLVKELIERFNAERQILAALNHPYIAALIDSGATEEGVPYIIMEYVDGIPIDEYCDRNNLDITQRIRLIQKVAMAVQAAHQNLVVHRDLKPSNVLITADGIPKLLDFGIAKLIEPQQSGQHGNTTIFGRQAMTPDYASPEQILENKVTTASDVYTLGVLSYQLLVGERPYHIQTTSHRDMIRSIESLTVPKPSTRLDTIASADLRQQIARQRATTVERLQKALQGDIDNILLMALRQEPERRYKSIAQFSDDLGRFLRQLPVAAHADTFGYRMSKFLQRNWLPASAAVAVVLSLAAGVIAYAIQAQEAERQRDIARSEATNASDTLSFLRDVLFAGDPFNTDEAEQTVADVLQYAQDNLVEEYAEQPATQALLLSALADIQVSRADYERAAALSAQAITLYESSLGTESNAAANAYRINALALYYQNEYADSDALFSEAIDVFASLRDPDWGKLATTYTQRAMVQNYLGREGGGLEDYRVALQIYREQGLDDSSQLVTILANIGTEYLQKGDYAAADAAFVEVINIARVSDTKAAYTAMLLANHAGVLKNLDRPEEATEKYVEAMGLLTRSLGAQHPETIAAMTSLANHYRQVGDMDLAVATIRRAVAAADEALPTVDFIRSYAENVGAGILCLGDDVTLGKQLAQASLNTRRELLPPDHWAIASGQGVLGMCLAANGDYELAEQTLLQAYADLNAALGDSHEVTLTNKARLHQMYLAWGKPEQALQFANSDD